MESSSKRRKLDHSGSGLRHDALIDFEAQSSARVSTASTFVLQTDELLKEAKLDYGKTLKGVDANLHRLKEAVDTAVPHGPELVCSTVPKSCEPSKTNILLDYRSYKPL
jgi:U3 small nucleolar RNA-associated protein 22